VILQGVWRESGYDPRFVPTVVGVQVRIRSGYDSLPRFPLVAQRRKWGFLLIRGSHMVTEITAPRLPLTKAWFWTGERLVVSRRGLKQLGSSWHDDSGELSNHKQQTRCRGFSRHVAHRIVWAPYRGAR
jgi:hypothetical protein